jgi:hypothetical protein
VPSQGHRRSRAVPSEPLERRSTPPTHKVGWGRWAETSSSTSQLLQVLLTLLAECLARFDCSTCAPSVLTRVKVFSQRHTREIRLQAQVALHMRKQQRREHPEGLFHREVNEPLRDVQPL